MRSDQSFTVAAWVRVADKDGTYAFVEQRGSQWAPLRLGNDADQGLVFTLASGGTPAARPSTP